MVVFVAKSVLWLYTSYEGMSINNQPIPFPMDRDGHDFQALFKYIFYTCVQNCTRIELADVYGSSAPSYAQVKFWVGEFKRGRTSLEDDATDEEMCKKVRDLIYSEFRWKQALGISYGSVSTILHDRLGMHKLTARWVPKSLSDEQMATRASVCSALLKHFRSKDDFLLRLVTVDETWVHYY